MKKSILLFFLSFAFVLFSHSAEAASPVDLGGIYNPISIQIIQTPQQVNQQKALYLQSVYGASAYDGCRSWCSTSSASADPQWEAQCLIQVEGCLKFKAGPNQKAQQSQTPQLTCPPNSTLNGQQCICNVSFSAKDGVCVSNFDLLDKCPSIFGKHLNSDGTCSCMDGYVSDESSPGACRRQTTSCPSDQVLDGSQCITRDTGCQKAYGQFSLWNKAFDSEGRYLCDCATGYAWNTDRTACIVTAPIMANIQTPDQIITEERALTKHNKTIANKYRGRILLQSSPEGQAPRAWYVNPKDMKRYYLSSDSDILSALQKMAKYVTPSQFKQLQKNPKTLLGYFVVVTKGGGNYFANIADKKVYEIQIFSGSQALTALVAKVGMTVKEEDLRKIGVGGL